MHDAPELPSMTVEEYFDFDERSEIRHEYVAGEVYAMPGSTVRHSRIGGNLLRRLFPTASLSPCETFVNAMRLEVAPDRYYYPDVVVVCTPVADSDVVVRNPCLVVEIASPDTARIDRGEKLDAYRSISTLQAYLIVDHQRRRVERHFRDASGAWRREEVVGQGRVPVPCLDVELGLDEIYRRVELPVTGEPEPVGSEP